MEPFLLLFGVMKGNRLSPFLCDIQMPGALGVLVSEFFKPPKQDTRGNGSAVGGGAVNTAVIDAEIEVEEQADTEDSVEIVSVDLGVGEQLSVDAVACYVNEIKNIDDENLAVEGDHQKEDDGTVSVWLQVLVLVIRMAVHLLHSKHCCHVVVLKMSVSVLQTWSNYYSLESWRREQPQLPKSSNH
jgi:hypothetical protein